MHRDDKRGGGVVESSTMDGRVDAVRATALQMLMRLAGESEPRKVRRVKTDASVRRLILAGHSERDIRHALGIAPDQLIAALWRIAQ